MCRCALSLEKTDTPKKGGSHFRCPQHYCAVCPGSGDGKDMAKCLRCPNAYHANCLPPAAKRLGSTKPCKVRSSYLFCQEEGMWQVASEYSAALMPTTPTACPQQPSASAPPSPARRMMLAWPRRCGCQSGCVYWAQESRCGMQRGSGALL